MTLIPLEMMQNMVKISTLAALQNPNKQQLLKSINNVEDLNSNTDLPDNVKADRLARGIKDIAVMADKSIPKQMINKPEQSKQLFDDYEKRLENNIPKIYQRSAKALLQELKLHPNRLQIDNKTNEVSIDGRKLVHSNFIDLLGDIVRKPRKTAILPLHANTFLNFLGELNIPEDLIGNKARVRYLRKYKSHNQHVFSNNETDDEDEEIRNAGENDLEIPIRSVFKPRKMKVKSTKIKRKLETEPYMKSRKYSWKTV